MYPEMIFIALLILALLYLAFLVAIFNTPSQQERDYQSPQSYLRRAQTFILTMP